MQMTFFSRRPLTTVLSCISLQPPPHTVLPTAVFFQILIFHHKSDLGQQLSRILDIKASRGVIPICFKGTINLPISRPRRREAQKDYWSVKDIVWRPQILVRRHAELMTGGVGACRRSSRAPCGWAPSMPSESNVIRRMTTVLGTLMTEWPTLPPIAPPISHLHPLHTKQLLIKRRYRQGRSRA